MGHLQFVRATVAASLLLVATACGGADRTEPPSPASAASIGIASGDGATGTAGTVLTEPLVVLVTDARGNAVPNATVSFAVAAGNGSVSPTGVTTGTNGRAQTLLTLGATAGTNHVTASVTGVAAVARFTAYGVAGPAANLRVLTPLLRLHVGTDTARVGAIAADQYGNQVASPPTWLARDPTLLSVDPSGFMRVLRRGGETYVVAHAGTLVDSAYVVVLSETSSPCTGVVTAATLDIGGVDTSFAGGYVCVHATTTDAEYELVPYFNTAVPASVMQIELLGDGLGVIPTTTTSLAGPPASLTRASAQLVPNDAFESTLRQRERALAPLAPAARQWYAGGGARPLAVTRLSPDAPAMFDAIPSSVRVGDLLTLNASITDCTTPSNRIGRVAAITSRAIVVADTANPAGGFTDTEYRSIGTTFDTLVDPLDEQAFGVPTDIDGNGHVLLFFTRAVNELTSKTSSTVVLGYFYARDLLPRTACPTSNQGELFYLMVPDSAGVVTGQTFSKTFVTINTVSTTAHEFQHLINASRRLYVTPSAVTTEEAWLNEGLSHIAEELLFYRVSGLQPRQNVDSAMLVDPAVRQAYTNYHRNNALRYSMYLQATTSYAPQGATVYDDALQTRGAIWSFLRYAADRRASTDGDFWYRLVNSTTSGMANLTQVLGVNPTGWMHDWAISNLGDDWVAGIASAYTQPSWNTRSYFAGVGIAFPLATSRLPVLADTSQRLLTLRGGGVAYLRFTVPSGQDALILVTANGQPLPTSMQLSVVRVK